MAFEHFDWLPEWLIFNNYSPKAKWLLMNIHRDEVEVKFTIITEPEANNCFFIISLVKFTCIKCIVVFYEYTLLLKIPK